MKHTLSQGSGYLVIDHTDSPGVTEADVAHLPKAMRDRIIIARGGTVEERDVQTCTHCERQVVLEPNRVRARAYCPHCDHYICDACEAVRVASGGACIPFKQRLDVAREVAVKYAGQPDHPEADVCAAAASVAPAPRIVLTDAPPVLSGSA